MHSMATLTAPRDTLPTSIRPHVYCSDCGHELEPWEVQLLKYLACPFCGEGLEFGASIQVESSFSGPAFPFEN